jgi:hypothetical protein
VHRFTDPDYADLSLAMRTGQHPEAVFDALRERGAIRLYPDDTTRSLAVADEAVTAILTGRGFLIAADTREQAAHLNKLVRDQLVAAGRVDDTHAATTLTGQRLGAGDLVTTRRNDRNLDVANRDTWTLTSVRDDGSVTVTGQRGVRTLPAGYVRQHVELGYAATIHATQGETTDAAHLLLGEHTSAAAAYVAMTRGRDDNTAHLVATTIEQARERWIATFDRDRADLGPGHAATHAAAEADRYATGRPVAFALTELRRAWTIEADCRSYLTHAEQRRDDLRKIVPLRTERAAVMPGLEAADTQTFLARQQARQALVPLQAAVTARTEHNLASLRQQWDQQRDAARAAAHTIQAGAGRLGRHRGAVRDAHQHLERWADQWRPIVPTLPTDPASLVHAAAAWYDDPTRLYRALEDHARQGAEAAHHDYPTARHNSAAADQAWTAATHARHEAETYYRDRLSYYGNLGYTHDPQSKLTDLDDKIADRRGQLDQARADIAALTHEPAIRSLPVGALDTERTEWQRERATARQVLRSIQPSQPQPRPHRAPTRTPPPPSHGISR